MLKFMKGAVVAAAGLTGVVAAASPAHADTRCSWNVITINSGAGAEPPSYNVKGHSHATGNHYISYSYYDTSVARWIWVYYADNNGGSNGDTWDTFYGSKACTVTP